MDTLVLTLDQAGLPQAWVALEAAITYHAKGAVGRVKMLLERHLRQAPPSAKRCAFAKPHLPKTRTVS